MSQSEPKKLLIEDLAGFPSQKYSLQKKNSSGFFVRVATFDQPVSQETVFKEFGPGYFILKATKPRFSTVWKSWLGPPPEEQLDESKKVQLLLKRLDHKTNIIGLGVIATAAGELIGFPLAHLRFVAIENKIDQIVGVLQTLPANSLHCPACNTALNYMLQPTCASCGVQLTWPKTLRPTNSRVQPAPFVPVNQG